MNDIVVGVLNIVHNDTYSLPNFTIVKSNEQLLKEYEGKYKINKYGYVLITKKEKNGLQTTIKRKGGIFKQSFYLEPLNDTDFICNNNGATAKFTKDKNGEIYVDLKIQGANLHFSREK